MFERILICEEYELTSNCDKKLNLFSLIGKSLLKSFIVEE
jgi:hypothetical protein